jgi:integrase
MNEAQAKAARPKRKPDNMYLRNGVWWIRYNVSGRKIRVSLKTKSLREAKRLRDQILAKRATGARFGIEAPVPRKEYTFAQVVEAWQQSRSAKELQPASLRDGEAVARLWLLPRFGKRQASEITVKHIEQFIASLRTTRSEQTGALLSRAYVARICKYLGEIFRYAYKRQILNGPNPYEQLDKRPSAGPGRDVYLTVDEALRLLDKLTGETYYKTALALATGLRWGEIHGLAWADIDLDSQPSTITIRRSWQGDPKSETSATTAAISDDAAAVLRQWQAEQGSALYVFPNRAGETRKRAYRQEERRIAKAAREAGIISKVTPHVFRHTFATWAYERVQDPRKLQRLMRHASLHTSMGYVHDRVQLGALVNQLPAMSRARLKAA